MTRRLTGLLISVGLAAGCADEPPPPSADEFVENPILLEAAMVRCSQDRDRTRYEAECINAREAVKRIEAKEEALRRIELEKQSEAKRRALRRTQEAAAEARRRATEAEQRRREEAYLAQFGASLPEEGETSEAPNDNTPTATIPEAEGEALSSGTEVSESSPAEGTSGEGSAPPASPNPEAGQATDLEAVRDELRRRADSPEPGGEQDDGS